MHTLLLRLAGPMQSWGTQSRFNVRDTGREPSKSGVIGLIAAALGRRREEAVDDLSRLTMGVRVDREGTVRRDYQTALDVARANDRGMQDTVLSDRYYLADADFLVGLSSDDLTLLQRVDEALGRPAWPLFLGRKAFVPGTPLRLPGGGVREEKDLEAALRAEPWHARASEPEWRRPDALRLVLETKPALGTEVRTDQPASGAAFAERRFLPRSVKTGFQDDFIIAETSDG